MAFTIHGFNSPVILLLIKTFLSSIIDSIIVLLIKALVLWECEAPKRESAIGSKLKLVNKY